MSAGPAPTSAEVDRFGSGRLQAAADLSEGVRAARMTKQHRDEVIPAADPLGCSHRGVLPNRTSKGSAIDQGQDLREATGSGDHEAHSACGWNGTVSPWMAVDE